MDFLKFALPIYYDIILGSIMTIIIYKNAGRNDKLARIGSGFVLLTILIAEIFF